MADLKRSWVQCNQSIGCSTFDWKNWHFIAYCFQKPRVSRPNQDSIGIFPLKRSLWILIADGAGGMPHAGKASESLLRQAASITQEAANCSPVEERGWILELFGKCQRTLRKKLPGSGSTLTLVRLGRTSIECFHAGDSDCCAWDRKGDLFLRTFGHGPAGLLEQAGMISPAEGLRHQERHLLTNYIGAEDFLMQWTPGENVSQGLRGVVSTDGLWDNLPVGRVRQLLLAKAPEAAGRQLIEETLHQMLAESASSKPDDLSGVFFFQNDSKVTPARRRASK